MRQVKRKAPPVSPDEVNVERKIEAIIQKPEVYDQYLGFGGAGDALLVLAACHDNPKAHVTFFANNASIPLTKDFFRIFNVQSTLMTNIMGRPVANVVYDRMKKLPTFKQSAHLADGLYYGDWANEDKYIPRVINKTPWKNKFGTIPGNIIVVVPSGSHRGTDRQRYLERHEYETLVKKYLVKGYEVYGVGSDRDFSDYNFMGKGVWWATNRTLRNWQSTKSHGLTDLLKIINSAVEVVSVDTCWKTYSLLAGVPTTILQTRWNGRYKSFGEDVPDWIFLNKKIWPEMKITKVEDFLVSL